MNAYTPRFGLLKSYFLHGRKQSSGIRTRRSIHLQTGEGRGFSRFRRAARAATISKSQLRLRSFSSSIATSFQNDLERPGLFSIPGLHTPKDFLRLAQEAIQHSDVLRDQIPTSSSADTTSKHQAVDTLYQLDKISQTVCNVIDAAELCRSAHASEAWREAANHTFQQLQQYIATLNSDQRLYNALVHVDKHFKDQLTEEEGRFCFLLKREFELDGIHLPDQQRHDLQLLHHQVVELETQWMSNITHSQNSFWTDAAPVESVIPKAVLMTNGAVYDSENRPGQVHLLSESPIAHSISNFSPNGNLRKEVHWASMTSTPENKEVLEAMRQKRHELALALGFESYAARNLQDKMAQSPRAVVQFLNDLEAKIQRQLQADLDVISRAKAQIEGSGTVEAWDMKFYSKLLKSQLGVDPNKLASFLGIDNCLNAMQVLVDKLFGIDMKEEELLPGESWDDDLLDPSAPKVHPNERIRKFVFQDQVTQEPLGTMYLDLHPRPGKYTHAAHFTVRCGCRVEAPSAEGNDTNAEYQLPIVALVCNMNSGSATLTSHGEVETLFHEFGHALHSLLSRTNFQHMSGTRAAMDFVETPSHLIEHYVWDPSFVSTILCPNIPDQTVKALVESRHHFRCLELQNQIVLSRFDQGIFGIPGNGMHDNKDTQNLWTKLHRDAGLPFVDGSHWYTNVGHLVTYGASYYGYLYSQVFASAIWNEHFAKGQTALNRTAGHQLWKSVLQHGGAKDPQRMLHDLLGHKPTVGNYWSNLAQ